MIKVISAKPLKNYKLSVVFSDKRKARIHLQKFLWGKAFEPLKNVRLFNKVMVDRELGTVTWPNGADIAPEALYAAINESRKN